jgi:hypothetical protein
LHIAVLLAVNVRAAWQPTLQRPHGALPPSIQLVQDTGVPTEPLALCADHLGALRVAWLAFRRHLHMHNSLALESIAEREFLRAHTGTIGTSRRVGTGSPFGSSSIS